MVKGNNNKQDKNNQFYAYSNIFEPTSAFENKFFPLLLAEFADPNCYVSFMDIIKKSVLWAYSTMILTKTLFIFKRFKYWKSL